MFYIKKKRYKVFFSPSSFWVICLGGSLKHITKLDHKLMGIEEGRHKFIIK